MARTLRLMAALLAVCLLAGQAQAFQHALNGQVRYYETHREFLDRPAAADDLGYGLAYELREANAYWQLGALYVPDAGADDQYDFAATPFLNLVFKDRAFVTGLGILQPYVSGDDGDEWEDLYWNLIVGLEFPLKQKFILSGLAIYDFKHWGRLADFDFNDVEFALALSLLF